MGVKLDYTVESVMIPWRITYVQRHAYEGTVNDRIRTTYVIAPTYAVADAWAEELNHHGDIYDILEIIPVVDTPMQLAYESYLPQGEEYYVCSNIHPVPLSEAFKYEHQADNYAKTLDPKYKPKVVVHYMENNDE